jgi:uncharacterized 2Fe-2S/4Fe-4S cluster protein (DUF4445 family)
MNTLTARTPDGAARSVALDPYDTLLDALRAGGFFLPAVCGGRGTCGKCKVRAVAGAWEPVAADAAYFTRAELDAGWRLACVIRPSRCAAAVLAVPDADEGALATVDDFDWGTIPVPPPPDNNNNGNNGTNGNNGNHGNNDNNANNGDNRHNGDNDNHDNNDNNANNGDNRHNGDNDSNDNNGNTANNGDNAHNGDNGGNGGNARHAGGPFYGIAIDIGTTTVALRLVDLRNGTPAGKWTAVNRQREWGADVLSRIRMANEGGLALLSQCVRAQIAEGIRALCAGAGISPAIVARITVAANTTMVHLLLGLSCQTLGVVPFTPVTLGPVTVPCRALFDVDSAAEVTVLPGVSTYVGADIVAGIFFTGMYLKDEPSLLLDIGTNGEMALCADGAITVAATAAGPAFEGGNIRWGTGSVPGAISRMRYGNGVWAATTIDDRPPVGICGTGLISAVWQGLRHGFIASGGNYDPDRVPDKALVLARNRDGENITLEQKDIRELQLAKSAVCSGLGTLLNHAGIDAAAVGALYVAGGFGHNIDYESAAGIGLIPSALHAKVRLVGNSALGGAVRCLLDPRSPAELARIIARSAEYNLSGDRSFNESFLENMVFD